MSDLGPPAAFVAGDTVRFTVSSFVHEVLGPINAAEGWTCSWRLNGAKVVAVEGTGTADGWSIVLPSDPSSRLHPGGTVPSVLLFTHATFGRLTHSQSAVVVTADPAQVAPGDGLSVWARIRNAAVDALAKGFEGGSVRQYMIGDEQYLFNSPADCWKTIRMCDLELAKLASSSRGLGKVFAFTR
jgi:hypothetical protein